MKKLLTILSVIMLLSAVPIGAFAWTHIILRDTQRSNWDDTANNVTFTGDNNCYVDIDLTDVSGDYYFHFYVADYTNKCIHPSVNNTEVSNEWVSLGTWDSAWESSTESWNKCKISHSTDNFNTYRIYLQYVQIGDTWTWQVKVEGITEKVRVTISPNGGSFITSSEEVTLTSSNGKDVHYTTDGSTPTENSLSVESGGTINITSSATVKAIASDGNGSTVGSVASADFTITPPANNEAGLYLYGSSFDAVSPTAATKLHYKLKPLPGETNKYYFDLFAASYTMENVQSSTGASGTNITASLDGKAFRLAYIAEDQGSITTYGTNGSPTWQLTGNNSSSTVQKSFSDTKNPWEIINCDGYYRFVVVTDGDGVPQKWYFEIVKGTYVGYKLGSSANGTVDGFYYMTKDNQDAYNNNFFGTCNFKQDEEFYFIVGNQTIKRRYNERETTYTKNIGQADETTPNLTFEHSTGTYVIEFNVTRGDYQLRQPTGTNDPFTLQIIGSAVTPTQITTTTFNSWDVANRVQIPYDETNQYWELSRIHLTKDKLMRFLVNNSLATNFGEDTNFPGDGIDTWNNNYVTYESSASSGTNISFDHTSGYYKLRFYVEQDNANRVNYRYTLELLEEDGTIDLSYGTSGSSLSDNYTTRTTAGGTTYNSVYVNANQTQLWATLTNAEHYKFAWGFDADALAIQDVSGSTTRDGSSTASLFYHVKYEKGLDDNIWDCKYSIDGNVWDENAQGVGLGYIFVKVQPCDENGNLNGEAKIYRYEFLLDREPSERVGFIPQGGFFINKVRIETHDVVSGIGIRWKGGYATKADAQAATYSTKGMQQVEDDVFYLSTPGWVAVVDADGNVATGEFDFTYSTSENYKNYYNNGKDAQTVAQAGGKNATNIFLKKSDFEHMRIYAYDWTYDQTLIAAQTTDHPGYYVEGENGPIQVEKANTYYTIDENDEVTEVSEGTANAQKSQQYFSTGYATKLRDPYVKLTADYPGTLMSDSRSIEIGGETYYYLTLPYSRLNDPNDHVGIVVSRVVNTGASDISEESDRFKYPNFGGVELSGNSSFIYNSVSNGGYYRNSLVDISSLIVNDPDANLILYTNPNNWNQPWCYAYTGSDNNGAWPGRPMTKVGDYWCMSFPNGYSKVIFNQGNNTDQSGVLDYGGGRKFYNHTGTFIGTLPTLDKTNYDTFMETEAEMTMEIQRYPNGKDYVDAVPSDKTILLDPTWGGKITDPLNNAANEENVPNWNGVEGNTGSSIGYRKMVTEELTQMVVGLDKNKTYTVQAIVRGWGEDGDKLKLTVGGGTAVEKTFVNASAKSYVNKNGRVDDRYTEGPDPDDPYIYHNADYGWMKIEASGKPNEVTGNLVITLTPTFVGGTKKYDLADVILLEDANTDGHYWTKLPTDETSVAAIKAGEIELLDRTKYDAFSFFDRNEGNPNAIIKASNRTVIGLRSGIADVQAADGTVSEDAVDHIQSRNTISQNEDGATWSGRYLYLYDESGKKEDCNAYGATVSFTMIGAKYDRKFTSGNHSTIFLPYSLPTSQLKAAGFTQLANVKEISDVNSDITLNTWDLAEPTGDPTVAGKGYIVVAGNISGKDYAALENFYKPSGGIAVQPASAGQTTEETGLVGNYKYCLRYQKDGNYMNYSYQNNKFRALSTSGAGTKPFRATFAVPLGSNASRYTILNAVFVDVDDIVPTAIDGVEAVAEGDSRIYTLDGRLVSNSGKLSELPRGIYVRNGRKIVVK